MYTCPSCGRTSYNPNDALNRYCGYCHVFEADKQAGRAFKVEIMNQSGCDWDAVFAPPIQDDFIFAICNQVGAFKGWFGGNDVWAHIRAASSWEDENCRAIVTIILKKLPDDVWEFLRPRRPLRDEDDAKAEFNLLCEVIFGVLQDMAEFMRLGDAL
jgi:hypothetical protein